MTTRDDPPDVCIIVEGAYPFVVGGVSSWLQDLMENLPRFRFGVVAISAGGSGPTPFRIDPPANVAWVQEVPLAHGPERNGRRSDARLFDALAGELLDFLERGGLDRLARVLDQLRAFPSKPGIGEIMGHPAFFDRLAGYYERTLPLSSFHHFFWALRTLIGGLLATLLAPLPPARVYHTISTGFAGLLAARARLETGRPVMITEHGIYLLERQIEIMMAEWIGDRIDAGLPLANDSPDLRDLWCRAFAGYTRTCYEACDPIVALYEANSRIQARLGATPERLEVIPNGVDLARFASVERTPRVNAKTVALIGRVVPIKDVETFIRAAAIVLAERSDVEFVVLGPLDEDQAYAEECRALIDTLGIDHGFTFAGRVKVDDWLPRIDVVALTSLSEAQPLVILEAGACGIPSVASDVGSCRELLEGGEAGGIVTSLRNPEATAGAILRLVADDALRESMGTALRARVQNCYDRAQVHRRYSDIYARLGRDAGSAATSSPRSY